MFLEQQCQQKHYSVCPAEYQYNVIMSWFLSYMHVVCKSGFRFKGIFNIHVCSWIHRHWENEYKERNGQQNIKHNIAHLVKSGNDKKYYVESIHVQHDSMASKDNNYLNSYNAIWPTNRYSQSDDEQHKL